MCSEHDASLAGAPAGTRRVLSTTRFPVRDVCQTMVVRAHAGLIGGPVVERDLRGLRHHPINARVYHVARLWLFQGPPIPARPALAGVCLYVPLRKRALVLNVWGERGRDRRGFATCLGC